MRLSSVIGIGILIVLLLLILKRKAAPSFPSPEDSLLKSINGAGIVLQPIQNFDLGEVAYSPSDFAGGS